MAIALSPPSAGRVMRAGAERPRHVVIVGGGRVGAAISERLPVGWSVVVVDADPATEALIHSIRPDAGFVQGDAGSRLTLAQCRLDARSVLIAATSSDLVNRESARIARAHFGVEECVVVADEIPGDLEVGESLGEFVRPADAVAGKVVNRVSIEASRAVDIGLGVGEILQVTVLEGSPAAGRPLRDFSARHWLVAAVYRGGTLIVPHGNTRVAPGDRVLLVGEPTDLEDVAPYFRGGAPVFPSQYGSRVAWVGPEVVEEMASWFAQSVEAEGLVAVSPAHQDVAALLTPGWGAWLDERSIGCVVMPGPRLPWYVRLGLVRSRLHAAIVATRRPFLILRGHRTDVRRLLVCIRDARSQRDVLLTGIDLARLLGASIETLTVEVAGLPSEETEDADIDRIARLYGVQITHRRVTGNPVARIRDAAKVCDLLVLGVREEHNSPFVPDVSTFLLHDLPVNAIFVPWSSPG